MSTGALREGLSGEQPASPLPTMTTRGRPVEGLLGSVAHGEVVMTVLTRAVAAGGISQRSGTQSAC